MAKKNFTVTSNGQSFTVPKGHYVGASPYVSMRLPDAFADPTKVRLVAAATGIQRKCSAAQENREPQSACEVYHSRHLVLCFFFSRTSFYLYILLQITTVPRFGRFRVACRLNVCRAPPPEACHHSQMLKQQRLTPRQRPSDSCRQHPY